MLCTNVKFSVQYCKFNDNCIRVCEYAFRTIKKCSKVTFQTFWNVLFSATFEAISILRYLFECTCGSDDGPVSDRAFGCLDPCCTMVWTVVTTGTFSRSILFLFQRYSFWEDRQPAYDAAKCRPFKQNANQRWVVAFSHTNRDSSAAAASSAEAPVSTNSDVRHAARHRKSPRSSGVPIPISKIMR